MTRPWKCRCEECTKHPDGRAASEHRQVHRLIGGLDEKHARRLLGFLGETLGHGGIAYLSRVTGMSRTTILRGQRELRGEDPIPVDRVRRPGGGRKPLEKKDQT